MSIGVSIGPQVWTLGEHRTNRSYPKDALHLFVRIDKVELDPKERAFALVTHGRGDFDAHVAGFRCKRVQNVVHVFFRLAAILTVFLLPFPVPCNRSAIAHGFINIRASYCTRHPVVLLVCGLDSHHWLRRFHSILLFIVFLASVRIRIRVS